MGQGKFQFWFRNQAPGTILLYSLAALAVLAGVTLRLRGLGEWPLAIDEYFLARSVRSLLENGVPVFACGGYYVRGILIQYLMAPLVSVLDQDELALRLVTVFFNLLAMPAVFMIGWRIAGKYVAVAALVLFSLSVWEIEIARYARMYAPFQALFLWYLWFMLRFVQDRRDGSFWWMCSLSVAAALVYKGGVFLVLASPLALILAGRRTGVWKWLVATAILILAVLYMQIDFRHLGVDGYLAPDVAALVVEKSSIRMPYLLLPFVAGHPVWLVFGLLVLVPGLVAVVRLMTAPEAGAWTRLTAVFVIAAVVLNQLMLAFVAMLLALLWNWFDWRLLFRGAARGLMLFLLLAVIYWVAFGLLTQGWHTLMPQASSYGLRKVFVLLFKYPNVLDPVVYEYIKAVPYLSVLAGGMLFFALAELLLGTVTNSTFRFLYAIIILMVALVGLLDTTYRATLYTFFLYPLILILGAAYACRVIRALDERGRPLGAAGLVVSVLVLLQTEDYNLRHLASIDDGRTNFRMDYDWDRAGHYVFRLDYRTPALMLREQVPPGAKVLSTVLPVDYYFPRIDYFYRDYRSPEFPVVSACQGERELWTNARLVYREEQLRNMVDHPQQELWVVIHSSTFEYQSELESYIEARHANELVGAGVDGTVAVYRISATGRPGT